MFGDFDEGCRARLGSWGHAAWWCVVAIQENICSNMHEEEEEEDEVPPPTHGAAL